MDQQYQAQNVSQDPALPPRGNLSEGGATVEYPASLRDMGLGNGAFTVNGGSMTPNQAPSQFVNQTQQVGTGQEYPGYQQGAYNQVPAGYIPMYAPGQPAYAPNQQATQQAYAPTYQTQQGYIPTYQAQTSATYPQAQDNMDTFDYSKIEGSARVAIYDDLHSAPRVIQIPGGPTHQFIEQIASITYQNSQQAGGRIPYSVIREVSENFIHAQFKEVVVSILDSGNTIRFTDQGPGIKDKELVQMPGVTSATEPMKGYIRGVGSGLPLVKDALSFSHGTITIEDNVNSGAVVTISLMENPATPGNQAPQIQKSSQKQKLTTNDKKVLKALIEGPAGVTAVSEASGMSPSSVHNSFERLTKAGLVTEEGKERLLTAQGLTVAREQ